MRTQVHQPTQQKVSKAAKVPTSPRIKARGTNWPAASVWLRPENMVYPGVSPFPSIQAKLTIGQPGDRYEQEADRIADQVVREIGKGKLSPVKPERDEIPHRRSGSEVEPAGRNPVPTVKEVGIGSSTTGQNLETDRETGSHQGLATTVQRQCGECEEKEKEKNLQTKPPAAGITPLVQRQNEPGAREEEEPSGEASEAEETVQEKADSTFPIQRQGGEGEDTSEPEEQEEPASLQTKAEGPCARPASPSLTARLQATKGSGQHLSAHTRAQMEGAFGADLSGVRIHTDGAAVGMNRDLRAQAFTHGRDIYFGSGKFQPETTEGRRLLAHELVHVGQQGGGTLFDNSKVRGEKGKFVSLRQAKNFSNNSLLLQRKILIRETHRRKKVWKEWSEAKVRRYVLENCSRWLFAQQKCKNLNICKFRVYQLIYAPHVYYWVIRKDKMKFKSRNNFKRQLKKLTKSIGVKLKSVFIYRFRIKAHKKGFNISNGESFLISILRKCKGRDECSVGHSWISLEKINPVTRKKVYHLEGGHSGEKGIDPGVKKAYRFYATGLRELIKRQILGWGSPIGMGKLADPENPVAWLRHIYNDGRWLSGGGGYSNRLNIKPWILSNDKGEHLEKEINAFKGSARVKKYGLTGFQCTSTAAFFASKVGIFVDPTINLTFPKTTASSRILNSMVIGEIRTDLRRFKRRGKLNWFERRAIRKIEQKLPALRRQGIVLWTDSMYS
ncbi:MAG: DUF4157 domain-containing protein, partial [Lewinellaceae bacterium]|nr:DUF4157 domain-containing protein [Lewinellaceae bacterium]